MAKQSQMRALLTIGKMGKRFQENESPWRDWSVNRSLGVGWDEQRESHRRWIPTGGIWWDSLRSSHPTSLAPRSLFGVTLERLGNFRRGGIARVEQQAVA